jgi:hypothetical protein
MLELRQLKELIVMLYKVLKENFIKSSLGLEIEYWFWKSTILNFEKDDTVEFLLNKEKEIKQKYPSSNDGDVNLPNSLTSRYSYYNLFNFTNKNIEIIKDFIKNNIKELIIEFNKKNKNIKTEDLFLLCWYNVLRKNEKIDKHSHRYLFEAEKSFISGHFTVKCKNTNTNYSSLCNTFSWPIENIEGQLIMFPTYLTHCTDKNLSDEPRISIAFDLYDKKTLAKKEFLDNNIVIKLNLE